jgi:hypothetical protein
MAILADIEREEIERIRREAKRGGSHPARRKARPDKPFRSMTGEEYMEWLRGQGM